jgi:protein PsiE
LGLKLKKQNIREFNHKLLNLVENIGLLVIGVATVFAMGTEVLNMMRAMQVTLSDLLLLFLYLEVFAMVGLYYQSGKLPVRFPLYIAMVALARYIILDMKSMDDWRMVAVTASIMMLTIAVFLIRYGHVRFPYPGDDTSDLKYVDKSDE